MREQVAGEDLLSCFRARSWLNAAIGYGAAAAEINPEWLKAWSRMAAALIEAECNGDAKMMLEKGRDFVTGCEDLDALYERACDLYTEFATASMEAQTTTQHFLDAGELEAALNSFSAGEAAAEAEGRSLRVNSTQVELLSTLP